MGELKLKKELTVKEAAMKYVKAEFKAAKIDAYQESRFWIGRDTRYA